MLKNRLRRAVSSLPHSYSLSAWQRGVLRKWTSVLSDRLCLCQCVCMKRGRCCIGAWRLRK